MDIRDIPQSYDKTLIATLPFKIKNPYPTSTIFAGNALIIYLENNDDVGMLLITSPNVAIDEFAFLGQIVAIVE